MFHMRLFDEHKDFEKDQRAHPDRLLSRGDITLRDLKWLLAGILPLEAIISAALGWPQFVIWICIFGWSLLMLYEFFVPRYLGRHMGLYLFSHQLVIPITLLFAISQRVNILEMDGRGILNMLLFFVAAMCTTTTFEIARKTWSKDREHEDADSYTKEWGIRNAVLVNQATAVMGAGLFCLLYVSNHMSPILLAVPVICALLFLFAGLRSLQNSSRANSKMIEGMGALYSLGLFVNSAVGFFMS